ncbi:MAG: hypothetical protein EAZ36_03895, partial [Verrucomicrobia bacterium]
MSNPALDRLLLRLTWDDLDLAYLRRLIALARDEDLAGLGLAKKPAVPGDRSTSALATTPRRGRAHLVARTHLVACGLPLLPLILSAYGPRATAKAEIKDGHRVAPGEVLATIEGDPRVLLAAERVALNFLQRLSGVATTTAAYVAALGSGYTRLLDTRKTTPLIRFLEKWAVKIGGCENYRWGLYDWMMIKDNHVDAAGGIQPAIERAHAYMKEKGITLDITVEIRNLVELEQALPLLEWAEKRAEKSGVLAEQFNPYSG